MRTAQWDTTSIILTNNLMTSPAQPEKKECNHTDGVFCNSCPTPTQEKCACGKPLDHEIQETLDAGCKTHYTHQPSEGWEEKFDEKFIHYSDFGNSFNDKVQPNGDCEIKSFIKALLATARREERGLLINELRKQVKRLEITRINRKYDGDDLEGACKAYSIAAENWAEIIRYEDGYNVAILEVLSLLTPKEHGV